MPVHHRPPGAPRALPAAIGCAVFNVATTAAIYRAVTAGTPLTHRVVTVSGSGVNEPKNLLCPIGTPIRELLDACGGVKKSTFKILMGGPMMGHAQFDMEAPIGKGTNAILAFCEDEERTVEYPACIRCGKCASVCPMKLQPLFMYQYEQAGMLEALERANVIMPVPISAPAGSTWSRPSGRASRRSTTRGPPPRRRRRGGQGRRGEKGGMRKWTILN